MTRLRRKARRKKIELSEIEKELLIPDYSAVKLLTKKEIDLEMEHLRLEIRLNKQIRQLLDKEFKQYIKKQ